MRPHKCDVTWNGQLPLTRLMRAESARWWGGVWGVCISLLWTLRLLRRSPRQSKRRRQNARGCLSLAPWPLSKQAARCGRKLPTDQKSCPLTLHSALPLTCCVILAQVLSALCFFLALTWASPSLHPWPSIQSRRPQSMMVKSLNCEGKLFGFEYWIYRSLLDAWRPVFPPQP